MWELTAVFEMKTKLFDNRVREHFAGDAFYFGVSRGFVQRVGQSKHKILTLPHAVNSLILHLPERIVNGLPLRIEDGLLRSDIDMSLHFA